MFSGRSEHAVFIYLNVLKTLLTLWGRY